MQDAIANLTGVKSAPQPPPQSSAPKFDLLAYQQAQAALEENGEDDGAAALSQGVRVPRKLLPKGTPGEPKKRGRPKNPEPSEPTSKRRKKGTGSGKGGWSRGMKLGPRRNIDPGPEFNALYAQATNAFIENEDTERAMELIQQAIAINPEVYAAHALLSEILLLRGEDEKAVAALFLGAHTAPTDPDVWFQAAEVCLARVQGSRQWALQQAAYCYSQILHTPSARDFHREARFKRATCYRDTLQYTKAMRDLEVLLQEEPHNSEVLRQTAEICIFTDTADKAKEMYENLLAEYRENGIDEDEIASPWADILVYVQILALEKPAEIGVARALQKLKQLARWMLGRDEESYWDAFVSDDREFDSEDEPRRILVQPFALTIHPPEAYGIGLPVEIRARLGILRLKQGKQMLDEALAHFEWLEPEARDQAACVYEYPDVFLEVADALFELEHHDQALRFYQAIFDTDALSTAAFFLPAAECFNMCGKRDQAIQCYENAKAADKDSVQARSKLSRLYAEEGDKVKAIETARDGVRVAQRLLPKTGKRRYEPKELRQLRKESERALRDAYQLEGELPPGPPIEDEIRFTKRKRGPYKRRRPIDAPVDSHDEDLESLEDENVDDGSKPRNQYMAALGDSAMTEEQREAHRAAAIPGVYNTLLASTERMRIGDEAAKETWLDCAAVLIADFKDNRDLFSQHVDNQSIRARQPESATDSLATEPRAQWEAQHASSDAQKDFDQDFAIPSVESNVSSEFRGITFTSWLDIVLEHVLLLAKDTPTATNQRKCYSLLESAIETSVGSADPQTMLTIHVTYLACTLALKDARTMHNVPLKWFLETFRLNDDVHRLCAAMRLAVPPTLTTSGREYRQTRRLLHEAVQAIDASISESGIVRNVQPIAAAVSADHRNDALNSSTTKRPTAASHIAYEPSSGAEHLPNLFLLLGQILDAAGSTISALQHYFRALALSTANPVIFLSIALSYMHSLRYDTPDMNRPMRLMQGWSFFEEYVDARREQVRHKIDGTSVREDEVEREIEFNRARIWHMLGMGDLAVRGYEKVLTSSQPSTQEDASNDGSEEESVSISSSSSNKDSGPFSRDAGYALATMYALSGNASLARDVTEKCLTI
jgi:general transcription factor 3C polypeptide 3 (transcription factor C subunit 4)